MSVKRFQIAWYDAEQGGSTMHNVVLASDYDALSSDLAAARAEIDARGVMIDWLEARLAEVEKQRDEYETAAVHADNRRIDAEIEMAELVSEAQDELRLCQQDAIALQARLAEAERLLREYSEMWPREITLTQCEAVNAFLERGSDSAVEGQ